MTRQGQSDDAEDYAAIVDLAEHFSALVDALHDGTETGLDPERIVSLAHRVVPGAHYVGITGWVDGQLRSVAATDPVLVELDDIRNATGEGPALDAIEGNDLVLSGDLAADPRWPGYGSQVLDRTGIRSLISYRLYLTRRHCAALTLCSPWPHGFTDLAVGIGAIFAAYSCLAALADSLHDPTFTDHAGGSVHREIGVAIGILMATGGLDSQTAYARLHAASHHVHQSLSATAASVVKTGALPT